MVVLQLLLLVAFISLLVACSGAPKKSSSASPVPKSAESQSPPKSAEVPRSAASAARPAEVAKEQPPATGSEEKVVLTKDLPKEQRKTETMGKSREALNHNAVPEKLRLSKEESHDDTLKEVKSLQADMSKSRKPAE